MDKIRSWPRWIRYGLISALVALTLTIPAFIDDNLTLFLGPFFPALPLVKLCGPVIYTPVLLIAVSALYWFLIGGLIGKFIKDAIYAGLLWLGILYLTWMAGLYYVALAFIGN